MGERFVGTSISAFLKRPRPLSVYLLALCTSLTAPILIVAAFMTWRYADSEELRLKHSTEHTGEHIVHAIEHQQVADMAMLRAMATSLVLRHGDFPALAEQADKLIGKDRADITLVVQSADRRYVLFTIGGSAFDVGELSALDPAHTISDFVGAASYKESAYYMS